MDAKLKKKWVEALMSGKYRQGKTLLYGSFTRRHCCLGVLWECAGEPRDKIADIGMRPIRELGVLDFDEREALADMNDSGIPFEVIAGFIQENL